MKNGDTYSVGYYQNRGDSPSVYVPLFKQLSFGSAFNVVCAMNGGNGDYNKELLKVLEMCQPNGV